MLMRLNLLCSRLEMTILPPPGGPMAARRNIDCEGNRKPGGQIQGTHDEKFPPLTLISFVVCLRRSYQKP